MIATRGARGKRCILLAENIRSVILSAAKNPLGRVPCVPIGAIWGLALAAAVAGPIARWPRPDPPSNGFFAALRMTNFLISLLIFILVASCKCYLVTGRTAGSQVLTQNSKLKTQNSKLVKGGVDLWNR